MEVDDDEFTDDGGGTTSVDHTEHMDGGGPETGALTSTGEDQLHIVYMEQRGTAGTSSGATSHSPMASRIEGFNVPECLDEPIDMTVSCRMRESSDGQYAPHLQQQQINLVHETAWLQQLTSLPNQSHVSPPLQQYHSDPFNGRGARREYSETFYVPHVSSDRTQFNFSSFPSIGASNDGTQPQVAHQATQRTVTHHGHISPEQRPHYQVSGGTTVVLSYPSEVRNDPSDDRNHPNEVRNHPSVVGNHPSVVGNNPSVIDNPSVIGSHPSVVGNHPSVVGNHPSVVGNYPGEVRNDNVARNHPSVVHQSRHQHQQIPPRIASNFPQEAQRRGSQGNVALLHPSLRNLSPHDLAVALLRQDKLEVSHNLKQECIEIFKRRTLPISKTLWCVLELLLNVNYPLKTGHTLDWIQHLVAGGERPADFADTVARHDTRVTCGIVWTKNFLAHRCNTCCIAPCMSLCSRCFNGGNHRGHDYNLFRSQSGGACDCGNPSVLQPQGFCGRHNPRYKPSSEAPPHMLLMLELVIPHLVTRLVYHFREASTGLDVREDQDSLDGADDLLTYCQELCQKNISVEILFRNMMCSTQAYEEFNRGLVFDGRRSNSSESIKESVDWYLEAMESMPVTRMPDDYHDTNDAIANLKHSTLLEEFVFWMVKFEFPERLSCFLLSMRPDKIYEEAFTRAFVCHYGLLNHMLTSSADFTALSARVVHVSVQLFSDTKLALKIVREYPLLDTLVVCLRQIMEEVMVDSPPHGLEPLSRPYKIVNVRHRLMTHHCFWPFLSDLNSLMSHRPIADILITSDWLRHQFLNFIAAFQFMNPLDKRLKSVDEEPEVTRPYVTAYSCEVEATEISVWNLVKHLVNPEDEQCISHMLVLVNSASRLLHDWFKRSGFAGTDNLPDMVSFHLPIHRLLLMFLSHATRVLHIPLARLMPSFSMLNLALTHPLKTMLLYHETMAGLWKSPIFHVSHQVSSYCRTSMGHSILCADLYLMQMAAAHLRPEALILSTLVKFGVVDLLELYNIPDKSSAVRATDHSTLNNSPISADNLRLEIFLIQMCFIAAIRTHWERDIRTLVKKEIASQLCIADRTHSELVDLMPGELLKTAGTKIVIKKYIKKLSIARSPYVSSIGECVQAMYRPKKRVWKKYYDPIHVLLRALCRRSYHDAEKRYHNYLRSCNIITSDFNARIWPPFVLPAPVPADMVDPRRVLCNRTCHAVLYAYLYKAVYEDSFNMMMLPYLVYLLEMAVDFHVLQKDSEGGDLLADTCESQAPGCERVRKDVQFNSWYCTDHIFTNATTVIGSIAGDRDDGYLPSDEEMDDGAAGDVAEIEPATATQLSLTSSRTVLSLPIGSEMVPYCPDATPTPETPLTPLTLTPLTPPLYGGNPPLALPPPPRLEHTPQQLGGRPTHQPLAILPPVAGREMVVLQHSAELLPSTSQFTAPDNPPPLGPPPHYPPLLAGTEVGRPGTGGKRGVYSLRSRRQRRPTGPHKQSLPSSSTSCPPKFLNESMISLLVKLYPKLSSGAQYRPHFQDIPQSRVGDGAYFIRLLLDKMGHHDSATRTHINTVLATSSGGGTAQAAEEAASSEDFVQSAKAKRARNSELRKQMVMDAFKKKQKIFCMENKEALGSININEGESSCGDTRVAGPAHSPALPSAEGAGAGGAVANMAAAEMLSRMSCSICGLDKDVPLGLAVFIMPNSSDSQRRLSFARDLQFPLTEAGLGALKTNSKNSLISCAKERYQAALAANYHVSWQLWENRGFDFSVVSQTCGHFVHLECQKEFHKNLQPQDPTLFPEEHTPLDTKHGDYFCTMCRAKSNTTVPLPPIIRHWTHNGSIPQQPYTAVPEQATQRVASLHHYALKLECSVSQRLDLSPPTTEEQQQQQEFFLAQECDELRLGCAPLSPEQRVPPAMGNEGLDTPVLVYRLLQEHHFQEYTGHLKEYMVMTYERITGMPLSRLKHILDDAYNTCRLGYLNSCLRASLEAQLTVKGGLLVQCRTAPCWDPTNLLSVSMFHVLWYSSQALSHQVMSNSNIRQWVSDRWGQLSIHPTIATMDTYNAHAMTSTTTAQHKRKYSRSQRYNHHQQYLAEEDLEELDDLSRRYHTQPVLPLLACDAVAVMLQLWLMLPADVGTDIVQCIIMQSYRLAIVQAVLAALRDLNTQELREEVAESTSSMGPLIAVVYNSVREYDSRVFYKHPSEVANEKLFSAHSSERDDGDEVLIEMRLKDIAIDKRLGRESRERTASLKTEDVTESDDSDSDHSERSDGPDYEDDESDDEFRYTAPSIPIERVEEQIEGLCLDFLRVAALLLHQLYNKPLPVGVLPDKECGALEDYLGLSRYYSVVNEETIDEMCSHDQQSRPWHSLLAACLASWCPPLLAMASSHWEASSVLLRRQLFAAPAILQLPKIYEFLFKFYKNRPCEKCNSEVTHPMVCLMCGAVVCHQDPSGRGKYHYVQHSNSCGGTQGIFLCINQTCTVIVRGPRVMMWDSLYLDVNGEEDRGIRRGRTLRLCRQRVQHLQHRYVTNSLDSIYGRWLLQGALTLT